jgi:hypothetical protein
MISHPSNTRDYCDAVLVVQSDLSGCNVQVGGNHKVMGHEDNMTPINPVNNDTKVNGKDGNSKVSADAAVTSVSITETLSAKHKFELYQNSPNPFKEYTVIGFYLPEAAKAQLLIYDLNGKLLKNIPGNYSKGHHEIMLDNMELQTLNNVLYYQIETDRYTATKKMIRLD